MSLTKESRSLNRGFPPSILLEIDRVLPSPSDNLPDSEGVEHQHVRDAMILMKPELGYHPIKGSYIHGHEEEVKGERAPVLRGKRIRREGQMQFVIYSDSRFV